VALSLRYAGWATTTGPLAKREEAWARQAQREAEAELTAIKRALEEGATQAQPTSWNGVEFERR
jgi:hypothetical protein